MKNVLLPLVLVSFFFAGFVLNSSADTKTQGDELSQIASDNESAERLVDEFYDAYDAFQSVHSMYLQLHWELREDRLRLIEELGDRPTAAQLRELRDWHMKTYAQDYAELKLLSLERAQYRQAANQALREYNGLHSDVMSNSMMQAKEDPMEVIARGGSRDEARRMIEAQQVQSRLNQEIEAYLGLNVMNETVD